jgi:hypothetical protein
VACGCGGRWVRGREWGVEWHHTASTATSEHALVSPGAPVPAREVVHQPNGVLWGGRRNEHQAPRVYQEVVRCALVVEGELGGGGSVKGAVTVVLSRGRGGVP